MVKLRQGISINAFEVCHKIDQLTFNRELSVTDYAQSLSAAQSYPLFIRSNVECIAIIVGRVDRLQALHDKPRNNHKNRSWRGIP